MPDSHQADRVESLRRKYPVFKYTGFALKPAQNGLRLKFEFEIPPDFRFAPEVVLEAADPRGVPAEVLEGLVFNLGLIEMLSYWKAVCAPSIRIEAGALESDQIEFLSDLLNHGMREYFFSNQIDFRAEDFVSFESVSARAFPRYEDKLPESSILPIGGGRDSALTAALFQDAGRPFECMLLNPTPASLAVSRTAGRDKPIIIRRRIDTALLQMNRDGFLNGHTPFSAYLAFVGAICLVVYGHRYIVIANERSSDEGNTVYLGKDINHQYSKSFRFERRFDDYLQRYLAAGGRYFSFLRPLYELQIGKAFSGFDRFFHVFKSCNRNQALGTWCGRCPKCLSVFLTMYPFISSRQIEDIFGRDYFDDESSLHLLRELTGLETHKPFECVCSVDEARASLALCDQKRRDAGLGPSAVLDRIRSELQLDDEAASALASQLLASYGPHAVPAGFEKILRSRLS
jgi:hypothetical protein